MLQFPSAASAGAQITELHALKPENVDALMKKMIDEAPSQHLSTRVKRRAEAGFLERSLSSNT